MITTDKKAMQLMGEVKETSKKVQQLQEEEYRYVSFELFLLWVLFHVECQNAIPLFFSLGAISKDFV